jgi:hypothetical protein
MQSHYHNWEMDLIIATTHQSIHSFISAYTYTLKGSGSLLGSTLESDPPVRLASPKPKKTHAVSS